MEWQQLIMDSYGRVLLILEEALDGLTQSDLNKQPRADCNSIGWLAWHIARTLDYTISEIMGEEQVWIQKGWHSRFNREAKPMDTGFAQFAADAGGDPIFLCNHAGQVIIQGGMDDFVWTTLGDLISQDAID